MAEYNKVKYLYKLVDVYNTKAKEAGVPYKLTLSDFYMMSDERHNVHMTYWNGSAINCCHNLTTVGAIKYIQQFSKDVLGYRIVIYKPR